MRAASSLEDFDKSLVYSIALLIGRGEASLTICVETADGEGGGRRGGSRVLRNAFKEISLKGRLAAVKDGRRRSLLKGQFDREVKEGSPGMTLALFPRNRVFCLSVSLGMFCTGTTVLSNLDPSRNFNFHFIPGD